ncbi:MAG: DUF4157 domain-containing protein [Treponema sp.]|jgi:hypothetical protein|nr:DUF4157 domain-containing protein [Treponema sp.]
MIENAITANIVIVNGRRMGPSYSRPSEQYTDYQRRERSVERPSEKDRVFPLETVELQRFNTAHGTDLNEAMIHTGAFADEYARSFNALALAIGYDIFFRNNAFNTGSEDGRKTLAHELTHVAQYEEGRINSNNSVKELEAEADASAGQEEYDDDPYFMIEMDNKIYKLNKSETDMMAEQLAEYIERKVYEQRLLMDEERYLRFLVEYREMLEGMDGIFDTL